MASSAHGVPLDLHVVYDLLEQAGVTDFDPQVLTQLVEYRNRFVQGRISEALIRIDTGAPMSGDQLPAKFDSALEHALAAADFRLQQRTADLRKNSMPANKLAKPDMSGDAVYPGEYAKGDVMPEFTIVGVDSGDEYEDDASAGQDAMGQRGDAAGSMASPPGTTPASTTPGASIAPSV